MQCLRVDVECAMRMLSDQVTVRRQNCLPRCKEGSKSSVNAARSSSGVRLVCGEGELIIDRFGKETERSGEIIDQEWIDKITA